MQKKIYLFFLMLIAFALPAQKVIVSGTAHAYASKIIHVSMYTDPISYQHREITSAVIDSAGNFQLEFILKEIGYIQLNIDNYVGDLYAEPAGNYELIVLPPDSSSYVNSATEQDMNLKLKLTRKTEINALTMDYEKRVDNFLSADFPDFVKRTPQSKIDSFRLVITDFYSTVTNTYFKNYINYSIAALEQKTNKSEKKLYHSYLENAPVLYNHVEYMRFFNSFYKQKVQQFSKQKDGATLAFNINNKGSFSGAMAVLKRAAFLSNDTIRELVLIKCMYESYFDGSFNRNGITAILSQAVEQSALPEHRTIAKYCLASFSKLKIGGEAPSFELPDKLGITHRLEDLRNKKHVYLIFYDPENETSLQQLNVIPSLKKEYGERILFVAVSTDKTNAALKSFMDKHPKYDWLFLYNNTAGNLEKSYEIITLPSYYLIGPDGKFIQVPAFSPEQNIEQLFFELTKPKEKKHGIGNKLNNR